MSAAWDRVLATGSGELSWRVSIDGMPYEPVSHKSMERALSGSTAARYVGLQSAGLNFEEKVHLPTAAWEPSGQRIRIADVADKWTYMFTREPTVLSSLTATVDADDSTLTVLSTSGFASSGLIWIDSEAILYSALGGGGLTFTGCSRGVLNTLPQYHYTEFGDRLRLPEITNWPRSIEGQRVRIYVYAAGDSPTGDGEQIWVGVARTDPEFNGTEWSFMVDPLSSLLDVQLGMDLDKPYNLRGIYYSAVAPLVITIGECADANAENYVAFTQAMIAGFWEDQESFCEDVTANIRDAMQNAPLDGTFSADSYHATRGLAARPSATGAWEFVFTTPGASPKYLFVSGLILDSAIRNGPLSAVDGIPLQLWIDDLGHEAFSFDVDETYVLPITSDGLDFPGTVPRSTLGFAGYTPLPDANKYDVDETTNPRNRLYLTATPLSSSNFVMIEWDANGLGTSQTINAAVLSVDTANNFVQLDQPRPPFQNDQPVVATGSNNPEIKFGRDMGRGTLADFLQAIVGDTAEFMNTGAHPYLRGDGALGDFNLVSGDIEQAAAARPIANGRGFSLLAATSLKEIVEEECKVLGVFLCYGTDGRMRFRRLRVPIATEVTAPTINRPITGKDGWLSLKKSAWGAYNTIEIKHAYHADDDSHHGALIRVRDAAAYGVTPFPRTLDIAPRSTDPRPWTLADALDVGRKIFGLFAAGYKTLKVEVDLRYFETLLGDAVEVEWCKVPNTDGTVKNKLNVDARIGFVVARRWQPRGAKGSLTLLLQDHNFAGYTPATVLSGITGADGSTGPFTATVDADYFPFGTDPTDFWLADDVIRLYRWGDATAGTAFGQIVSTTSTTITFGTTPGWTWDDGSTWALGSRVSDAVSATVQKRDAYIANADGRLDFSGDTGNPAVQLAP